MELVYGFETKRVPADRPATAHCWLRLVAPDAPDDAGRAPLNLSLVLDRSGSMRGEKIQSVKDAARALISMLSSKDTLSVVSYAEDVTTLVPPSPVRDRDSVARMLDGLMARGGTNLSGGWLQGVAFVEKKRIKKGINRVLLMTDGLATRGILDTAQLVKMVGKKKRKQIATSTFGFGEGFNEDLLIGMSRAAGGAFYYIEDPDDAPHAFTQELGNLLSVVAQNFSVKLKAQGGAKFLSLLNGYPHTLSDSKVEAQAGDVYAGDARGFMMEMQLPAGLPAEGAVVAKGYVEFDDVSATKRRTIDIVVRATGGADPGERDAAVVREMALLRSGRAKEQALQKADAGDFPGARRALERCLEQLRADPLCQAALSGEVEELERFMGDFEKAGFDAKQRKSLSASIFASQMSRPGLKRPPGKPKPPSTHVEHPGKRPPPPPTIAN